MKRLIRASEAAVDAQDAGVLGGEVPGVPDVVEHHQEGERTGHLRPNGRHADQEQPQCDQQHRQPAELRRLLPEALAPECPPVAPAYLEL